MQIETVQDLIDYLKNIPSETKIEFGNYSMYDEYFVLKPQKVTISPPTTENIKHVDAIGPIFTDENLVNIPAFQYLPPMVSTVFGKQPMGLYRRLTELKDTNFNSTVSKIASQSTSKAQVILDSDDENLNIVSQMFEINDDNIEKLAIIDYGTYTNPDGSERGSIFHLGKVFRDSNNVPKFLKVFTLVFE